MLFHALKSNLCLICCKIYICSSKELEDFVNYIANRIDNYKQYVNDIETRQHWNDLVWNDIMSSKPLTTTVLVFILEITDMNMLSNRGYVIEALFQMLPLLRNY